MKISTKIKVWMTVLFAFILANSILGVTDLIALERANEDTTEDVQVMLRISETRAALGRLQAAALTAAVTGKLEDAQKWLVRAKHLRELVDAGLGPGAEAEILTEFQELKPELRALTLVEAARDGELPPLRALVDPGYRERLASILDQLEKIIADSSRVVEVKRAAERRYYRSHMEMNFAALAFFLFALALAVLFLRRSLYLPFRDILGLLGRVRQGDLTARWTGGGSDELAEMGSTINSMNEELLKRRQERVEFIASVAHDLKNPITAIQLLCDTALRAHDRGEGTPKSQEHTLRKIGNAAERMKRLTADLLESAKESRPAWSLERDWVDLGALARKTVELADAGLAERLRLQIPPGPVWTYADPGRLGQVLMNLVSNAAKYSPPGSPIEVSIASVSEREASVEVLDRGVGIPDNQKRQIFEPFSRLDSGKKLSEGFGLGLAIVRDIVAAHGGSVTVLDREGGGSVFRVILPSAGNEQPGLRTAASQEKAGARATPKRSR